MTKFLKQHGGSLLLSVLLHLALLGLLGVTLSLSAPPRAAPRLAIEAVVVDSSTLPAAQRQQAERQTRREAEARLERDRKAVEEKRQQEIAVKREAEERATQAAQIDKQRKAEQEAQRKATQAKLKAEEAAKLKDAEMKRKADAAAKKKAADEAAKKKAADEKRKAEAAAKRKQEETAKREREAADMRRAIQEEEELRALEQSDAMNQYQWLIQQRIERSWIRPPSAREGLSCELNVIQTPSGVVIDVRVGKCNGDDVVVRSLEAAVLRASPLPEPPDPRLFSRNLIIDFQPES